jgi:hypothetical protein
MPLSLHFLSHISHLTTVSIPGSFSFLPIPCAPLERVERGLRRGVFLELYPFRHSPDQSKESRLESVPPCNNEEWRRTIQVVRL